MRRLICRQIIPKEWGNQLLRPSKQCNWDMQNQEEQQHCQSKHSNDYADFPQNSILQTYHLITRESYLHAPSSQRTNN